jgi:hypothetical protein
MIQILCASAVYAPVFRFCMWYRLRTMREEYRAGTLVHPVIRKLLFPIKAVTFVYRFAALLLWTAYLEGSRGLNG